MDEQGMSIAGVSSQLKHLSQRVIRFVNSLFVLYFIIFFYKTVLMFTFAQGVILRNFWSW